MSRIEQDELIDADTLQTLKNIELILNKAYPEEVDSTGHKLYLFVIKITKYLGIPALILAAILPVFDIVQSSRNSLSEKFLIKTFTDYAVNLSEKGHVERAEKIFSLVEKKGIFEPSIHYAKAKIFAERAILKGENIREAEDLINILIILNQHNSLLIQEFGKNSDFKKLILMLSEIHVSNANYEKSILLLSKNKNNFESSNRELLSEYYLAFGTAYVWTHEYDKARKYLALASQSQKNKKDKIAAEILFQKSKNEHFKSNYSVSINMYLDSYKVFSDISDIRGRIKCLNNLGTIYYSRTNENKDFVKSIEYYEQASELSKQLDDDVGVARSYYNIAAARRQQGGSASKALQDYIQSLEFFKLAKNDYGIASAQSAIGMMYEIMGKNEKAFFYHKQAFDSFIRIKVKANIGQQAGEVAESARALEDTNSFLVYDYISMIFHRANKDNDWKKNLRILNSYKTLISEEEFNKIMIRAKKEAKKIAFSLGEYEMDFTIPNNEI